MLSAYNVHSLTQSLLIYKTIIFNLFYRWEHRHWNQLSNPRWCEYDPERAFPPWGASAGWQMGTPEPTDYVELKSQTWHSTVVWPWACHLFTSFVFFLGFSWVFLLLFFFFCLRQIYYLTVLKVISPKWVSPGLWSFLISKVKNNPASLGNWDN